MQRRNRKAPAEKVFEELVEMSSILPWWISVGIAILLFAIVPFRVPQTGNVFLPNQMTGLVIAMIFGAIFKYAIPAALFLGGLKNLFQRGKSAWMFKNINTNGAKETLRELSWKDFEFLISEYFKKENFRVDLINANGADGGIDIKLYKNGELFLVQCKHYKAWKVPVQVVRELYGLMSAENAVGGYVVTTGKFTNEAFTFATNKKIILIDGSKLEKILDNDLSIRATEMAIQSSGKNLCPRCGNELVVRSSSRGQFFGCSSFPKCRYTRDLK